MTKTQQELRAYLECDNPESRRAAGIALYGVGYRDGARFDVPERGVPELLANVEPGGLYLTAHKRSGHHSGLHGWPEGCAALAESLARFCAVGLLLLALALPAQAATKRGTVPRASAPAGLESKAAQCAWIEGYAAAWRKAGKPDHGAWADWLTVEDSDCETWGKKAEQRKAARDAKAKQRKADKGANEGCTTDTDCARKHGGNGDPKPAK